MYTRDGQFTLGADKRLITQNGYQVMGQSGGAITLDGPNSGKDIRVEKDGTIYVDKFLVDKLKIVDFENKQNLQNMGGSLFANTKQSEGEIPAKGFLVEQGAYETSNVNVMNEMVRMIGVLRAYESYSRVDQSAAGMLDKLIDLGKF